MAGERYRQLKAGQGQLHPLNCFSPAMEDDEAYEYLEKALEQAPETEGKISEQDKALNSADGGGGDADEDGGASAKEDVSEKGEDREAEEGSADARETAEAGDGEQEDGGSRREGRTRSPPRERGRHPEKRDRNRQSHHRHHHHHHHHRRRSKSRSRRRKHHHHHHHHDHHKRRRKSRSKSRSGRGRERSRSRGKPMDRGPPPKTKADREVEERKKELEKLERDTRTVFAYNMSTKAYEWDLFEFFSRAGTVQDVQIIYDRSTGRSKGMAYVEMSTKAEAEAALGLSGQPIRGHPCMVKHSEAEKNIAWEAQQAQKAAGFTQDGENANAFSALQMGGGPAHLQVRGLHPGVSDTDLRAVFEPFGALEECSVERDDEGKSAGSARVSFKSGPAALAAITQLNGFNLAGQPLQVALAQAGGTGQQEPSQQAPQKGGEGLFDDESAGLKMDSRSRYMLMQRLAGAEEAQKSQPAPPQSTASQRDSPPDVEMQGRLGSGSPIPTECLLLKNMFDPEEETDPEWWLDIQEDVREECSKSGDVEHIWVDKDSKGFAYVKFDSVDSAQKAYKTLNGRYFNGRRISAEYQFSAVYKDFFELR